MLMIKKYISGGTCNPTVILVGNRHGDPSLNSGQGCLHFI